MAGIFLSYRRSDSAGYAGRLMDDLKEQFPTSEVFRDIEAIEAGSDFVEAIDRAVGSCSVLLALIGPRWLSATDAAGTRRIDDPNDFVRLEIATALRRDIKVIPILVEGAAMPSADALPEAIRPLGRRQAHELSDRRWEFDVEQLFAALEKAPGVRRKPAPGPAAQPALARSGMSTGKKVVLAGAGLLIVLGMVSGLMPEPDSSPISPYLALPPNAQTAATMQPPASVPVPVPAPPPAAAPAGPQAVPPPASTPPVHSTAAPAHADDMDDACGAPAAVAGTWAWAMVNGPPGVLVITQSGQTLGVAEFNALGQQIGMGGGVLCGEQAQITISNALLGQFVLEVTLSGGVMNGTLHYQGQQGQVQGLRQG